MAKKKDEFDIGALLKELDAEHPEMQKIEQAHEKHRLSYGDSLEIGKEASRDDAMAKVRSYVKHHYAKAHGGAELEDHMADHYARQMYRAAVGQNGPSLDKALQDAKKKGSIRDIVDSISAGFNAREKTAKVASVIDRKVGYDPNKQEAIAKHLIKETGASVDHRQIMSHYDELAQLYVRGRGQLKDTVENTAYNR